MGPQFGLHASAIGLAAVIISAVPSSSAAQPRWGTAPVPRAGACFYQDADFRGQYFCLRPGQNLADMPRGANDQISSVRVFGNTLVTVFRDRDFRGSSARFLTDVRNLRQQGWNDLISSARVTTAAEGWGRNRTPRWGRQAVPQEGACFYQDADFRGAYFCVPRGGSYRQVPGGFNDQISSIRVRGADVMIFADRDFGGRSTRVTSDVSNLRGNWRDRISSIRVF